MDAGASATEAHEASYVSEGALRANTTYSAFAPKVFIRGSNLYIEPSTITNVYMWYWDYPTGMSTASTEHGLPYGATDVLIAYALYRSWLSKDAEKVSTYKALYKDAVDEYLEFVSHARQNLTKDYVEIRDGSDIYDYF